MYTAVHTFSPGSLPGFFFFSLLLLNILHTHTHIPHAPLSRPSTLPVVATPGARARQEGTMMKCGVGGRAAEPWRAGLLPKDSGGGFGPWALRRSRKHTGKVHGVHTKNSGRRV